MLPFRNSPSESVLSFYVRADPGWGRIPTILLFYVHPSALRALAKRTVTVQVSGMKRLYHRLARWTSPNPKPQPVIVGWQNWGPEMTRWIEHDRFVCQSLSGTRCAISKGGGEVQLLDFNPGRVRKLESRVEEKGSGWENVREVLVNYQSAISAGNCFKLDIVSHLSYFEIRKRGAKGQLLIDDQWVVQIRVRLFQFTTREAQCLIYFSIYLRTNCP